MAENENKELIEKVLKNDPQDIAFEPIPDENESPLAQPVVNKNNTAADVAASKKQENQENGNNEKDGENPNAGTTSQEKGTNGYKEPLDAPEQEINDTPENEQPGEKDQPEFEIPLAQAEMAADSFLGMINNTVLEIGGGFFVTIKKHKDFYDFDELIELIDKQNEKNINRIKLDEEDKALLRPLLVQVLRQKAKVLTPGQQLLYVSVAIAIKKAKVVMIIRAENEMMVEHIRDIIREEIRQAAENHKFRHKPENEREDQEEVQEEVTIVSEVRNPVNKTGLPADVLEVS